MSRLRQTFGNFSSLTFGAILLIVIFALLEHVPSKTPTIDIQKRSMRLKEDLQVQSLSLSSPLSENITQIVRRDDFTCGVGKPCSNKACCGVSGFCGYGETYCGAGCSSNCDAVAECGKFAVPVGTKCPLNTCCSQHGFCGTTTDYCSTTNLCQSNCVEHPKPPGGGSGSVLQRVIGYYESWSDRLACHKVAPSDLPLDALTHLNYAFAYIDPKSFEIVTMDQQTPEALFQTVADVKSLKPGLKIWISVGGWTFSDNGTATQPVFGNIASTQANRETFARNVVKFCTHYGFDGIDLDWEYPGAPDRGGKPEDTKNYVSLVQTLRSVFNASPRPLGITFTAPSSYWYLKWFDLPGMDKYVDWINVMTYDLHGVWDKNNPIGSIVQGHTNLTEIGLAMELFWRVGISPSKIAMGFGFYGRSFQLSDPSCSNPGCQFSGGAAPGPCSDASGVLYYYEIMALLKQHPDLKPVHDKEAAVKYVVYNGNQWVSYDDAETFQQKVDWANKQGIGGSLIWASDADDSEYSAHSGLLGKKIGHPDLTKRGSTSAGFTASAASIAQSMLGQNGQECFIRSECTRQLNTQASSCAPMKHVGWEKGNCGGANDLGHSICCPAATAPSDCLWRGDGGDCNGQCHVGEATLFGSSWGGVPFESGANQERCGRGAKRFCCAAGDWKSILANCHWTDGGGKCNSNSEDELLTIHAGIFEGAKKYCCKRPAPLTDCVWKGKGTDCVDNACSTGEVSVALHTAGDTDTRCAWGRQRSACCKVLRPPPPPLLCKKGPCEIDPDMCPVDDDDGSEIQKRLLSTNISHYANIEKRGKPRGSPIRLSHGLDSIVTLYLMSRAYPSRGQLFRTANGRQTVLRQSFQLENNICADSEVIENELNGDANTAPTNIPSTDEAEHPLDLSMHAKIVQCAHLGRLGGTADGELTRTQPGIASPFWENVYTQPSLPLGLARTTPNSPDYRTPANRTAEALGSYTNRGNFLLTNRNINNAKGAVMSLKNPMDGNKFTKAATAAASGDDAAVELMLGALRTTIAAFNYMQTQDTLAAMGAVRNLWRSEWALTEANTQGGTGLAALFDECFEALLRDIENRGQTWVRERIREIRSIYASAAAAGHPAPNAASVSIALGVLESQITNMVIPLVGP